MKDPMKGIESQFGTDSTLGQYPGNAPQTGHIAICLPHFVFEHSAMADLSTDALIVEDAVGLAAVLGLW